MQSARKPTQAEKAKFLEYIEKRKGKTQPSNQSQNQPKTETSSNLYVIIMNDFFDQIEKQEMFQKYPEEKRNNFKANIADEILGKTTVRTMKNIYDLDKSLGLEMSLTNGLLEDADLENFFYRLDFLISQLPPIAKIYTDNLIAVYLELCKEFYVTPSTAVTPYFTLSI